MTQNSSPNPQDLASFLPRWQLRTIAERDGLPADASVSDASGAVLFVDVSGFTALTQDFARLGKKGAEQLSQVIDGIFGPVTDIILDCGGDIAVYAGDATLAVWPVDRDGSLEHAAIQASAAAHKIQNTIWSTGVGDDAPVRLRASVGVGKIRFIELGGADDQWLFMLDGDALTQTVHCDSVAVAGEVTLSHAAWSAVENVAEASPIDSDAMRLDEICSDSVSVRVPDPPIIINSDLWPSYLPRVVCQRIPEGHSDWLAEFRTVSVLVMNLERVDDDLEKLHMLVRVMQQAVFDLEGQVYQCLVDDKGANLLAAFGLPPMAHEDDAKRCLLAARAVHQELQSMCYGSSIGIATGTLWCGLYGTGLRRQYSIVGPAINLACRLMQQADGRILCDAATSNESRAVVCRSIGAVNVKGRKDPVEAFQPTEGLRPAARRESPTKLVGRCQEVEALTTAVNRLRSDGQQSVFEIEGEAGVGKSHLINHLIGQLPDSVTRCVGDCDAIGSDRTYAVWKPVLRQLLGLQNDSETDSIDQDRILQHIARVPGRQDLAPLLNVALQTNFPENSATSTFTSELRAARTRQLIEELISETCADKPAVVVLENGHWFDDHSWKLIQAVARGTAKMLLVVTTRPQQRPAPGSVEFASVPGLQRLNLGSLSSEDTVAMLSSRLDVQELPQQLIDLVMDRTAGNPLFAEQLVLALKDAGLIEIEDNRCLLRRDGRTLNIAAQVIPASLGGVVVSRADHLEPSQQLTLKTASVVGHHFTAEMLAAVHPMNQGKSAAVDLDELESLRFIETVDDVGAAEYRFHHALIRDVMYESIPFGQRRSIHNSIATWYEASGYSDRPLQWSILAHHWKHAEHNEKAAHYFGKAGTRALAEYANGEAVRYLGYALELGDFGSADERGLLNVRFGLANVSWSRYADGRQNLESGLAILDRPVPKTPVKAAFGSIFQLIIQLYRRLGKAHAGALSESKRDLSLQASRGYEGLVETYIIGGEQLACLYCALRALNVAESVGPSAELARGYASISALFGMMRLHGIAGRYARRALDTASSVDDREARAWTLLSVGIYKLGNADWAEAEASLEEAAGICRDIRHSRRELDCRISLSNLYLFRGDIDSASAEIDRCEELVSVSHDWRADAATVRNRVGCLAYRNDIAGLEACERKLIRYFDPDVPFSKAEVEILYAIRAWIAVRLGRQADAEQYADRAITAIQNRGVGMYSLALEFMALAEVLLKSNPIKLEKLASLEKLIRAHARAFPVGVPNYLWIRGRTLWLNGQQTAARQSWTKHVAKSSLLDMRYHAALGHLELAQSATKPDERAEHMASAEGYLNPLGIGAAHVRP